MLGNSTASEAIAAESPAVCLLAAQLSSAHETRKQRRTQKTVQTDHVIPGLWKGGPTSPLASGGPARTRQKAHALALARCVSSYSQLDLTSLAGWAARILAGRGARDP